MNPLSFILDNFLRGKEYYVPLRRLLDMLLSLSITSFVFQYIYFKYQWLDITDYKGILNFLLSGQFFIPLFLFLVVHIVCYLLTYGFFVLTTTSKTTKWREDIISHSISKKELNRVGRAVKTNPVIFMPNKMNFAWYIRTYIAIKEGVSSDQWNQAAKAVKLNMLHIEKYFLVISKAIIALTIYYVWTIPYLGVLTYVLAGLSLLGILFVFWYLYVILDVLPTLVRKTEAEFQKLLAE